MISILSDFFQKKFMQSKIIFWFFLTQPLVNVYFAWYILSEVIIIRRCKLNKLIKNNFTNSWFLFWLLSREIASKNLISRFCPTNYHFEKQTDHANLVFHNRLAHQCFGIAWWAVVGLLDVLTTCGASFFVPMS